MSLERADSYSPKTCAEQYKIANAALQTFNADCNHSSSSDTDTELDTDKDRKLYIDLNKMPAGQ